MAPSTKDRTFFFCLSPPRTEIKLAEFHFLLSPEDIALGEYRKSGLWLNWLSLLLYFAPSEPLCHVPDSLCPLW